VSVVENLHATLTFMLYPTDFLADSVEAFLTSSAHVDVSSSSPNNNTLSLGLTFSFPAEQQALDSGIILTWTKGFSAKNAAGKDVVQLLQNAFDKKHILVKCVALVNDVRCGLLYSSLCFR
jgi:hexokinase